MPDLLIGVFTLSFFIYIFIFNLRARTHNEIERRILKRIEYFITKQRILTILSYPNTFINRVFNNYEICDLTNILISGINWFSFEPIKDSSSLLFNFIIKTFPLEREEHKNHLLKVKILKDVKSNEEEHMEITKDKGWFSETTIHIMGYTNLLETQKNEIMKILNTLIPGKYKEIPSKNKYKLAYNKAHVPY